MTLRVVLISLVLGLVAGCASVPTPDVRRAPASSQPPRGVPQHTDDAGTDAGPQPVIRRGSGEVINRSAAARPGPSLGGASTGEATFNFEGESLQAVVKAILGDMLGQNYVIAPGVQGTVTLATPKPVSPAQALNLLEMVLGWNNARMVYSGGRYNIVAADQALAGTVAPSTAPAANARGFEVRVIPLRYISASEMKKVLEPYARANAIVGVDPSRNVITLGGTRAELETTCARSRSSTSTGSAACRWACSRSRPARQRRWRRTWRRCSAKRATRPAPACSGSCRWKMPMRCW